VYRAHSTSGQKDASGSCPYWAQPVSSSFSQNPGSKKARHQAPPGEGSGADEDEDEDDHGNWVELYKSPHLQHSGGYWCPLFFKLSNVCSERFETEDEAV